MGPEQQRILTQLGVPAHRIIIGHCCRTDDREYHLDIARQGSYLGFDQFGIEMLISDEARVASLVALIGSGAGDRVVVSHDSALCWRGEPIPPGLTSSIGPHAFDPTHFWTHIVPRLRDAGVDDRAIDRLVVENPRRFFEGSHLDALA
ncbi:MAG: hypothetical protein HKO98_12185 [Gemmatimonadetes bacterium]|nr:hypothetical protein [Gemmatimonadota bacterium]